MRNVPTELREYLLGRSEGVPGNTATGHFGCGRSRCHLSSGMLACPSWPKRLRGMAFAPRLESNALPAPVARKCVGPQVERRTPRGCWQIPNPLEAKFGPPSDVEDRTQRQRDCWADSTVSNVDNCHTHVSIRNSERRLGYSLQQSVALSLVERWTERCANQDRIAVSREANGIGRYAARIGLKLVTP